MLSVSAELAIRLRRARHPFPQNLPSVSVEYSYPEGVERLIGQGWREATTLSNGSIEDY